SFTAYTTGDLAAADFDRDGKLDVITVDGYSLSSALLLGQGNGTFTDPDQFGGGWTVAAGDFTGDGYPDVVEAWSGNTVMILLNDGNWGGLPPPPPSVPSIAVNDVAVTEGNAG